MRIDLHVHSTASDGSLDPAALVAAARAGGLDVVAIADHDTTAGIASARAALPVGLRLVPAMEVSTRHEDREVHVLGYLVNPDHPALLDFGEAARARRHARLHGMLERLAGLGMSIPVGAVLAAAGPRAFSIGRPHVARALVDAGHVASVAEAFDRYLADGGPAFLPTEAVSVRDAIELIHSAGGLAVWAHPALPVFEREIRRFADWGLDGVECFRPHNLPADTRRLLSRAEKLGLLLTGGSDWHGEWNGPIGGFAVDPAQVGRFLELAGIG